MGTFYQIKAQVQQLWSIVEANTYNPSQPSCVPNWNNKIWRPPRPPYLKVNCDAAYNQTNGKSCAGIIIRDVRGYVLTMSSSAYFASSPLMAEAFALREAMSVARNLNIQHAIFESDSQILIEVCRKNNVREELKPIMQDIFFLRSCFSECGFTWICQARNSVAHQIAYAAIAGNLPINWAMNPPGAIRAALAQDRSRITSTAVSIGVR